MKSLSMEEGSCVNLIEKVFATICGISSKSAFGRKHKGQLEAIMSVFEMISNSAKQVYVCQLFPSWKWLHVITGISRRTHEMCREVDLVLENIINGEEGKEEEEEENCLLSTLLNMKDQGDLTINQVKAVMLDMITAGIDTPPTTIEWAMAEMKNPRVMEKAKEEVRQVFRSKGYFNENVLEKLKYLKAIIKETLRLHPPAPFMAPRECSQICDISGYTIPAGTQVLVNVWAIGRDSNYWGTSAEEFVPERFLNSPIDYKGSYFEYIPFGFGKRICPGMLFGVAIVELVLANLLCHFDWELPCGTTSQTLDMTEYISSTLRMKNNLILVPISYNCVT
ncbi:premnaspirodiene oxygenase-like [Senna tora]|uniref:Premnaspirodiene oxygenase-like n=1 Tax=Senna tora TaxID=362788 RepID=A0A834TVZ0_9FABA|nr:premnaspirodiene oxygenase-like [Senna tora]